MVGLRGGVFPLPPLERGGLFIPGESSLFFAFKEEYHQLRRGRGGFFTISLPRKRPSKKGGGGREGTFFRAAGKSGSEKERGLPRKGVDYFRRKGGRA